MILEPISATSPELIAVLSSEAMPTSDLAELNRHFWRAIVGGETVGYAGLEIYGAVALLRSLVVLPSRKGRGHGTQLVEHALHAARSEGVTDLWLLTKTARPFFEHLGWQVRERTDAPNRIASSLEFESLCPASATCMSYQFDAAPKA